MCQSIVWLTNLYGSYLDRINAKEIFLKIELFIDYLPLHIFGTMTYNVNPKIDIKL